MFRVYMAQGLHGPFLRHLLQVCVYIEVTCVTLINLQSAPNAEQANIQERQVQSQIPRVLHVQKGTP